MFEEDDWNILLDQILSGLVVPIIGHGLMQATVDGQAAGMLEHVAVALAKRYGIEREELPPAPLPGDVLFHARFPREKRKQAYVIIKGLLGELKASPSDTLTKLARVRNFPVYVSTTFDGLLERTLNVERYRGESLTRSIGYSYNGARKDLPAEGARGETTVYQLFGQAMTPPYYAVTEGDYLEFFSALLVDRESGRLPNLTDLLDNRHVLFLGTAFPDWPSRFLLRFAKKDLFNSERMFEELIVDHITSQDQRFTAFVHRHSRVTKFYDKGSPEEFVDQLYRRWCQRTGDADGARHDSGSPLPSSPTAPAIFISYAREDEEAARRIRDQLRDEGIATWLDLHELKGGDAWDQKIRSQIKRCALFMPLVSASTEAQKEGYFRLEWDLAAQRIPRIAHDVPFLLPVVLDHTRKGSARVPERFSSANWFTAHGGIFSAEDRAVIREKVEFHVRHPA